MRVETSLIRVQHGLSAGRPIYARLAKFIRSQLELCALNLFYARSQRFISGEIKLCALILIYARALKLIYPRSSQLVCADLDLSAFKLSTLSNYCKFLTSFTSWFISSVSTPR